MDFLENIKIFDGHEHLQYPIERFTQKSDLFDILFYTQSVFVSAGLKDKLTIEKIYDYYKKVQSTMYGKSLEIIAKDLYNLNLSKLEDFYALDEKIREKSDNLKVLENWYDEIFKKNRIVFSLAVDNGKFYKHKIIKPIVYLDIFLNEKINEFNILADYLAYIKNFLNDCINNGMIAGKFATPYWHNIEIENFSFEEGEKSFELSQDKEKAIGYIFHFILDFFQENKIPIQFHTGDLEPTFANLSNYKLEWSNPKIFNKYATMYPNLKFILLHTGFPYHNETITLAKNHQNIYMDFSWIYLLSPTKSKEILSVAFDMIPNNKIIGFGGDCEHIECVHSHLSIAKKVVNEVLNEKVVNEWISKETAFFIAENIFWNNPLEIYNIII